MTFTILGRDPATGRLGGAAATSDLAVGARVLWARAGLGVAATQHRTAPRLGPALLQRLTLGESPQQAVKAVAAGTIHREWRQLGALDARGRSGSWGGSLLWPQSGAAAGEDCLAVGNMLTDAAVVGAMCEGFTAAAHRGGDLGDRLLEGLAAGQAAGGETGTSGLRSAALLIVQRESFPWADLRVDDDGDPLGALNALWHTWRPLADGFVSRAVDPDFDGARPTGHRPTSTTT
jgi:uncharacterized Ntn-hydrolase superfamily protein